MQTSTKPGEAIPETFPLLGQPHGHVTPRADGLKARCGGPMLCEQCRKERDASWPVIESDSLPVRASVIAAKRLGYEPFGYTERS